MWACGVSLFMWLYHRPPYEASNPPALLEKISTEEIDYPEDTRSSSELLNLLHGLLQRAPLERLRIRDLRHDAFLTEGGKAPFDAPLPFIMRSSSAKGGEKLVDPSSVAVDLESLQKAIKCVWSRVSIGSGLGVRVRPSSGRSSRRPSSVSGLGLA